jgi:hypothetical protein
MTSWAVLAPDGAAAAGAAAAIDTATNSAAMRAVGLRLVTTSPFEFGDTS